MTIEVLNGNEVSGMVEHWLSTPPNGYLGSSYGSDPRSLLLKPQSAGLEDQFYDKLRADVPVVRGLPEGAVNLYLEDVDKETKRLLIEVADSLVIYDSNRG